MRDYSLTVVDECAISGKLAVGDDQPMQHGKPTQHDLSTVYTVYTVYSYTVLYSKLFFPIHPGRFICSDTGFGLFFNFVTIVSEVVFFLILSYMFVIRRT